MQRRLTAASILVSCALLACATVPTSTRTTAGNRLGKVRAGMSFAQVVQLLGPPASQSRHITAQAFNPFHVGGEGQITEFRYVELGRVYFIGPDLEGGGSQVVAVQEDSSEGGL